MDGEYALISLKPDAYRRGMKKMILKTCKKAGLRVKYHKKMWLTEEMMRTYQPVLNQMPEAWQRVFIFTYLAHPTDVYLLYGEKAIEKTSQIKKEMRERYVVGNPQMTPFNLMHSASSYQDLVVNVKVLMPEKCDVVLGRRVSWFQRLFEGVIIKE